MATFAIGDIHGYLDPLRDVLTQLRDVVVKGDAVVFLGDYIDRGADSRSCIDAILEFRDQIPADVVCLRGNHEDWLLETSRDYSQHSWLLGMEGLSTVRSYSRDAERLLREAMQQAGLQLFMQRCELPYDVFFDAMPASHREFFSRLALSCRTADCICTHGGLDPSIEELRDQPADAMIWGQDDFMAHYRGELPVVYGHWRNAEVNEEGWPMPKVVGNTIGIDSIAHGVLTCIRMPDRRLLQSARYDSLE